MSDLLTRARAHPLMGGPPMPLVEAFPAAGDLIGELIAEVERLRIDARETETALRRARSALATPPSERIRELIAEVERCHKALHYIAGYDVAGYVPHLRSKDVARAALEKTNA